VQSEENVVVSVQDEGQGIPENELSKLFQAFQTTSVKSTSSEKSTGLGLMIAKKIITEHKGKIWVESNVGKGSSFFFTIPIPEEEIKKIKIDYHEDKIIKNSTENNKIENCKPELSPYLDKTVIENLKGIDPDFLNELIAMFLEQSPKLMDNLRQAIKDKDSEKIIQIADQLRGASENLGALQLGGLYNDLISKEKNRDINDYTGFLNSIDRLYELTKKALQEV
jgi:HPt (histidine-containing phosphotransfer) domain-containing protein